MGDPRKIKKKYSKPAHMWQKARIDEERKLCTDYGLASKNEIWKANSVLRGFQRQAKRLIAVKSPQSEKESVQLLDKLATLGLIRSRNLESVLDISLKDILDRRLQSVVFRKSLANSVKHARQMIVHAHVTVGDRKVTSPSFMVSVKDEQKIVFIGKSAFAVENDSAKADAD